jgi:hypothetical protein
MYVDSSDSIVESINSNINSNNFFLDLEKTVPKKKKNSKVIVVENEFDNSKYNSENANLFKDLNSLLLKPMNLPNYFLVASGEQNTENTPRSKSITYKAQALSEGKKEKNEYLNFKKNINSAVNNLRMKVFVDQEKEKNRKKKKRISNFRKQNIMKMKLDGEDINREKIDYEVEGEVFELNEYDAFFDQKPAKHLNLDIDFIIKDYSKSSDSSKKNVIESPSSYIMEALVVKQRRSTPIVPPSTYSLPFLTPEFFCIIYHFFYFLNRRENAYSCNYMYSRENNESRSESEDEDSPTSSMRAVLLL